MPDQTWSYYTINFTASASRAEGDAPVNLSFNATVGTGQLPYNFTWAFSNGGYAFGQSAEVLFVAAGPWTASLTVRDANNATSTATLNGTVFPSLELVAVADPLSGPAPLNVTFASMASGGDPPYDFVWSVSPGSTVQGSGTNVSYPLAGRYSATVTVGDQAGGNATKSFSVNVSPTAPTYPPLSLGVSSNRSMGDVPFEVQFAAQLGGGSAPYTYLWEFGDGTTSNAIAPSHTYETAGNFSLDLTATDSRGQRVSAGTPLFVHPALSIVVRTATLSGLAPLAANFSSVVTGGWAPYEVLWTYGDGSTGSGSSSMHTFAMAGNYSATAIVVDGTGARAQSGMLELNVGRAASVPGTSGAGPISDTDLVGVLAFALGAVAGATVLWAYRRRERE